MRNEQGTEQGRKEKARAREREREKNKAGGCRAGGADGAGPDGQWGESGERACMGNPFGFVRARKAGGGCGSGSGSGKRTLERAWGPMEVRRSPSAGAVTLPPLFVREKRETTGRGKGAFGKQEEASHERYRVLETDGVRRTRKREERTTSEENRREEKKKKITRNERGRGKGGKKAEQRKGGEEERDAPCRPRLARVVYARHRAPSLDPMHLARPTPAPGSPSLTLSLPLSLQPPSPPLRVGLPSLLVASFPFPKCVP